MASSGDRKGANRSSMRGIFPVPVSPKPQLRREKWQEPACMGSSQHNHTASDMQQHVKQVQKVHQVEQKEREAGDVAVPLKRLMASLGYRELLGGQEETLRRSAEGQDLVICSPTGSGKSFSLLLPLLQWHTSRSAAAAQVPKGSAAARGTASKRMLFMADVHNNCSKRPLPYATQEELPVLGSNRSSAAAAAVCTAEAVSLVVVPTATLGLQLLGEVTEAARFWLSVAAAFRDRQGDKRKSRAAPLCVPRLLLIDNTIPQQQQLNDPFGNPADTAAGTTTHDSFRKGTEGSHCRRSLRDLQRA
ncbi:uncharacterized protein EMH_0006500 [Eimeria mitis]|uniref:DEAD/DEAH-box helicase domain-containing protein n=1 Tax=Eimeria mitis TaxID=44415 RepID=U6KDF1_9EIME|nr:uncharacterized protein EMH_0006500 [Eimeria mitis]CDJ36045.1 hypothetical protein, conserved [Eimeria mitis]